MVTGIGAVTPIGNTFEESWEAARSGHSGLTRCSRLDVSDIPWKTVGEAHGFDPSSFLGTKETGRLDPFVHFAVGAGRMAAASAGLDHQGHAGYLASGGVIIGSGRGGISTLEAAMTCPVRKARRRLSAYLMAATTISMASSYTALKLGIKGYSLGISNACASGTNAIGEGFRLIRSGFPGPVIAGGAEAPIARVCIEGYGVSGALSRRQGPDASRPFHKYRDGFVLAEGACVVVLESLSSALRRAAPIYAEVIGYGNKTEASHQTRPDVEGEAGAINDALSDAGISAGDIDYISAHGTSTPIGDRVEAQAIASAFGGRSASIPVTAVKSMTGHMLAASGALEAAFTAMSLHRGVLLPTINLVKQDIEFPLNIVTELLDSDIMTAASFSFGFGGVNAVLVFRKAGHSCIRV